MGKYFGECFLFLILEVFFYYIINHIKKVGCFNRSEQDVFRILREDEGCEVFILFCLYIVWLEAGGKKQLGEKTSNPVAKTSLRTGLHFLLLIVNRVA